MSRYDDVHRGRGRPVIPGPDRHAIATRHQASEIKIQLGSHKAWLLHAEIIATVVVSARTNDERNEMRMFNKPRRAPKIAGNRNRNMHILETGPNGCMHSKKADGKTDNALFTHRVRRETVLTM